MIIEKIGQLLYDFMNELDDNKIEIYNEFSFQHELGIFLRDKLERDKYKVQFERNVSYFDIDKTQMAKKEIDIVIYNYEKDEKYAIELKYPLNGQYPESMFSFVKDIKFCEQLSENNFTATYVLVFVTDHLFYSGGMQSGIYKYFRGNNVISGNIAKPTGTSSELIELHREYQIDWEKCNEGKYYMLTIPRQYIRRNINQIHSTEKSSKKVIIREEGKADSLKIDINDVEKYITSNINEAVNRNESEIVFISGEVHKKLKMKNAMPTVCRAMRRIERRYPNSKIVKPETVKGENSSTIKLIVEILK